jgi:hypothetical protein
VEAWTPGQWTGEVWVCKEEKCSKSTKCAVESVDRGGPRGVESWTSDWVSLGEAVRVTGSMGLRVATKRSEKIRFNNCLTV